MPQVKIFLEPGETELDADAALSKALAYHSGGEVHDEDAFDDPAMVHTAHRLEELHARIYAEMVREIADALDQEYSSGSI